MKEQRTSRDIKKNNRIRTLRCILGCDRISQPELAAKLQNSWPTVLQNVRELMEMGLVQEVGEFASTGGRKARAFAPVRDARTAVGVEITQNHIGMVLTNLAGELVRYERRKKEFSPSESYSRALGEMVEEFAAGCGISQENLLGCGIALPGILDETGETFVLSHVLGTENMPTAFFSRYIPFPCLFVNDASAAGLAEVWGEDAPGNVVYLSLSNSVGGAILNGGKLYNGDHLRAGEFGHMTLVMDGKPCYCGKRGCLDAYCSAKVLAKHTGGNLEQFFDRLQADDPDLTTVWKDYLRYLATAVNNLRMVFDCTVIAGGYVGGYLEEYGNEIRQLLSERNTFEADAGYFRFCRYRREASAMGAALMQVEQFMQQL